MYYVKNRTEFSFLQTAHETKTSMDTQHINLSAILKELFHFKYK